MTLLSLAASIPSELSRPGIWLGILKKYGLATVLSIGFFIWVTQVVNAKLDRNAEKTEAVGAAVEAHDDAHQVHDNAMPGGAVAERGPGGLYGSGQAQVGGARTPVTGGFPDDRYLVSVEWDGNPGGREWIAEKTPRGFVIVLPAAPPRPLRARWIARGY